MGFKPTFKTVKAVLDEIDSIECPDGNNDGDPINSDTVYPLLKPEDQRKVEAAGIVHEYVRNYDGTPNRRAINTLIRNGFPASFNESQEDPLRNVGRVETDDWVIDVSDPFPDSHDE
jgi:hypothetical protein